MHGLSPLDVHGHIRPALLRAQPTLTHNPRIGESLPEGRLGHLEIGRRVATKTYGSGAGLVIAIHGTQSPETVRVIGCGAAASGGGAFFDIVFPSGSYAMALPECILRGTLAWTVEPGVALPEEIASVRARTDALIAVRAAMIEDGKLKHAAAVLALRNDPAFEHLLSDEPRSGSSLAAKNIRLELRRTYPAQKFSVRRPDHRSVTVRWSGGPCSLEVKTLIRRFEACRDLDPSITRLSAWCEAFGEVTYLDLVHEDTA